eukprot:comp22779_c0_seq1/m.35640 comp22779_c0_seq1/g.35640  ORF comp22779_c0_seq1/g.35640 comp22779_c0_seq1/m.35640 type:complete len:553 (-) comp22779_c0_seq1:361-2019(-)
MACRTFGGMPALRGLLMPATTHALREVATGGAVASVLGRQFSRRVPGTRSPETKTELTASDGGRHSDKFTDIRAHVDDPQTSRDLEDLIHELSGPSISSTPSQPQTRGPMSRTDIDDILAGFSVETDEEQKAAAAIRQMLKEGQVSEVELRDMIEGMRGDNRENVETEDVFRQKLERAGGGNVKYIDEERILNDLREIERGGRRGTDGREEGGEDGEGGEEGWARKGRRRRMEKMQQLGEMLRGEEGEGDGKGVGKEEDVWRKSVFDMAVGKKEAGGKGKEEEESGLEEGESRRGRKERVGKEEDGVEGVGVLDQRTKQTTTSSSGYGESHEDIPLTPFGQPLYPKERETKKMMEVAARYKPGKYGHMDLKLAAGSKTWDPDLLQLLDERSKRAVQSYYKELRREPPPAPSEEFSLGRLTNPLADDGPGHRSTMVGSNILKSLKRILARDVKTNPIWDELNIEITGVRMKSRAKAVVLWVNHGDYTDEQVSSMLELTKKNLRTAVQSRVNMKRAPEIVFASDPGDTPGSNINLQLEEVERDLKRMDGKGNNP